MKQYNNEKAVISLTSWKKRINTVGKTLFNLIKQCPGFHIVLVLSEDEFPNKESELPEDLNLMITTDQIEILWIKENTKAFKKVLYTLNKYRNVPVISADDDCLYKCNYAEELYSKWLENKDSIITSSGATIRYKITRGPNTLFTYELFKDLINVFNKLDLSIFNDDALYAAYYFIKKIKIIDIKKRPFYTFHTKENALSSIVRYRPSHDIEFYINQLKKLL